VRSRAAKAGASAVRPPAKLAFAPLGLRPLAALEFERLNLASISAAASLLARDGRDDRLTQPRLDSTEFLSPAV
jgi:hypothetical protein